MPAAAVRLQLELEHGEWMWKAGGGWPWGVCVVSECGRGRAASGAAACRRPASWLLLWLWCFPLLHRRWVSQRGARKAAR